MRVSIAERLGLAAQKCGSLGELDNARPELKFDTMTVYA
jgi:hypothetical protein